MAGERIRAGEAYVEITANDAGLKAGLKSAEGQMNAFRKKIDVLSAAVAGGLVVGFLGAAAALKGLSATLIAVGDQLDKMSIRTGVAVEALSKFSTMAQLCGTDVSNFETGLKYLEKNIAEAGKGSAGATAAFRSLGISLNDLKGLSPDQQFLKVASAMAGLNDHAQKTTLAMTLFGRSGTQLLPLLTSGENGIAGMSANLDRLGTVISTGTATAAAKLLDALTLLKAQTKALSAEFMANFAGALTTAIERIQDAFAAVIKFSNENRGLVTGLAAAGATFVTFGTTVAVLPVLFGKASVAVKAFGLALTAIQKHPVLAVLTVATSLVAGFTAASYAAGDGMVDLSEKAKNATDALDDQQRKDAELFDRLKDLNNQTSLTNDEMDEAESIVADLSTRYSDLGVSVNKATGEIEGMTDAQKKLVEAQKEAKRAALEAEIAEAKQNRAALESANKGLGERSWGKWANTGIGFYNSRIAEEEKQLKSNNAQIATLDAQIRSKLADLNLLNADTGSKTPTGASVGGQSGHEAQKAAEAFNARLAGAVKDTSAGARIAELKAETDAILAPLLAERDEELTNAKRREELNAQIAEIEENLRKNIDKINSEEEARLEAERQSAQAAEERRKLEEVRLDQQIAESSISGKREQIANKEADLRGLYGQLETASTQEEADRLAETIAKTNDDLSRLKWEQLAEDLEGAEKAFKSAQDELGAARASGDKERILSAQQAWERAYNDVTAAESARESAIAEYQKQLDEAYQNQLASMAEATDSIDSGLKMTALSRGGSFNAAAASSVANPVEQRVAKATEDSARYLRDILSEVKDFDGGEVAFA